MKTEFVLHIDIGPEATLGDANLADIVKKIGEGISFVGLTDNRRYVARDLNGNAVGHFGRYTSEESF